MRFFKAFASCIVLLASIQAIAQKGPGGVGNTDGLTTLRMWWRADTGITPAGGPVSNWANQSGYAGNDLSQATAGNRPTIAVSAALNNQTIVRYTGASSQFFNSAFSGPGVDNMTVFLVANGSSYQSLIRFQNVAGTYVVYPWEGAGRVFISSSDGGVGSGVLTGIVDNVNNVAGARYRRNVAVSGMQTFLNGGVNAQRTSVDAVLPTQPFFSGRYALGAEFPTCDVGEMMVYYSALNDAQMVIVQNYLAAKYDVALTSNDIYTMDNAGNGNFDYDAAGIGRVDASNIHNDSQGSGFVRILNPTDLGDAEFFMWGHNGLAAQANNTTDIPSGLSRRFDRVWRVSETGEVGNIDVQFDVTGLTDFTGLSSCDAASSIRLLVDTDNDGTFADQTAISGATNIGGNVYRFANVGSLNNNFRFTVGLVSTGVTGPGGIGGTNGTSNLALWLKANTISQADNTNVSLWADQSGFSNHANTVGGNEPTFRTSVLNGFPVIRFTAANTDYFRVTDAASLKPNAISMFIVGSYNPASSDYAPLLIKATNDNWTDGYGISRNGLIASLYTYVTQWNANFVTAPLATGTPTIITSVYNNVNLQLFYSETSQGTDAFAANITNSNNFLYLGIGPDIAGTGVNRPFDGDIAEVIVFNRSVSVAERVIIDNYLSAKYNIAIAAGSDAYTRDNPGNGNFDFEMAGIGRASPTDAITDAQGSGIVRISNPTAMVTNEGLLWGHNNGTLVATTADVPPGVEARFNRVWAVSEIGDVGDIDVQFDLSSQSPVTASDLRLLVDNDGDGVFNEGGTIIIGGAVALSCNTFLFSAVPAASIGNAMRFTLGTINRAQTPLPIELISFEGVLRNGMSELAWATATEQGNDYFTVERSEDGEKFTSLMKVAGAGYSTVRKNYSAVDQFPPAGKLYYRLKQTDYDGGFMYSRVILLNNLLPENRIQVSPNPVRIGNDLEVRIITTEAIDTRNLSFRLYDLLGRPIALQHEAVGNNRFRVKTGATPAAGFYILKIYSSDWSRELFQRVYLTE